MNGSRYLLLKASADRIPLMDNSVGLVIATPPMLGVRHRPKSDYCTSDAAEYDLLIRNFLAEATRVVQTRRHILLIDRKLQSRRRSRRLVFHVLQKQAEKGGGIARRVRSETFLTHFVDIKECPWWAISLGIYRSLVERYSERGEKIAHVFSGSGNGAIAALQLDRRPILIDLHYHRQVHARLAKTMRPLALTSVLRDGIERATIQHAKFTRQHTD